MNIWNYILSNITFIIITSSIAYALTAEDYKVISLPGIDIKELSFDQYAGHIEVSPESDGNLFFWMLEQEKAKTTNNLIIWLNGGPGCSSMDGMFLENGPYRVNPDLSLSINKGGWQDQATIVFLDQPVGTGFSYANGNGLMRDMDQIANEFIVFLEKFMEVFPNLQERKLYIAGESFAGTYIPYFARKILNINKSERKIKFNLQGLAIGNGWIAPLHQYRAYYDFSVAHGIIGGEYKDIAAKQLAECERQIKLESLINIEACEMIMSTIHAGSRIKPEQTCVNTYDIRLRNETYPACGRDWPHELVQVSDYLRSKELKAAIHSQKQALGWSECSSSVSRALDGDKSKPSYDLLPDLLKETKILLFSGEYDLICNHFGTEYLISNMTWNDDKGFAGAKQQDWVINGKTAGHYTEARGLTYVLIKDGSHMVPYDKPMETLDMINRFMGGGDSSVEGVTSYVGKEAKTAGKIDKDDEENEDNKQQPVVENEDQETPMESEEEKDNDDEDDDDDEEKENDSEKPKTTQPQLEDDEESWNGGEKGGIASEDDDGTPTTTTGKLKDYAKSNGSYGALVLLLIVAAAGCCWYRSSSKDDNNRNRSQSSSSGWLNRLQQFFGNNNNNDGTKLRLTDQDEANELDELVIENPTLFAAEGYSDDEEEGRNQHSTSNITTTNTTTPQKSTRFAIVDDDTDDGFDDFADWDQDADADEIITKKD
ncbi:Alpha/Beta hydrolase protein [Cunninghamella echinulata]|nr:Alpha/Beta hydrolase protein [Cunninghamella echinulata]